MTIYRIPHVVYLMMGVEEGRCEGVVANSCLFSVQKYFDFRGLSDSGWQG